MSENAEIGSCAAGSDNPSPAADVPRPADLQPATVRAGHAGIVIDEHPRRAVVLNQDPAVGNLLGSRSDSDRSHARFLSGAVIDLCGAKNPALAFVPYGL